VLTELSGLVCPVKMKCLGIADVFTESGLHDELLDKYGLAVEDIVKTVEAGAEKDYHLK
jgi:transketolase C-terminal domain/subunit